MTEVAEEIIRKNCKELDIEIIDMAMNVNHVHLFTRKGKRNTRSVKKLLNGLSATLSRI